MRRSSVLLLAALVLVQLPWLGRPVDFDEANFLTLARGAAADPWRPHDVMINWQGSTERAFTVLSNPPGLAWWLAPVVDQPIAVLRAWMLPWLALAVFGARRLGQRFGDGDLTALVLLTAPIVVLSAPALLPDAPLYACTLAGVAGFVDAVDRRRNALPWALLAGCAALFRYSGMALAPLLAVYVALRRRNASVGEILLPLLAGWAPLALLGVHDLHAYGAWHLRAMGSFQSVANTGDDLVHKGAATVAMLGGAAAIPLFRWRLPAVAGAIAGAALGWSWGWSGVGFAAAGGASLGAAVAAAWPSGGIPAAGTEADDQWRDGLFRAAWVVGGLAFLLLLRFAATRYWLPFLPGVLLALPLGRWARAWIAVSLTLGIALAADGYAQARGNQRLADEVASLGTGVFTGHWGWQWALEQRGWRPLDEGERVPADTLVAIPRQAWPQRVDVACATLVWAGAASPPIPWLPRGYSERGAANLHAAWIAGPPPTRTIAPWTFASDPYERARVCRD